MAVFSHRLPSTAASATLGFACALLWSTCGTADHTTIPITSLPVLEKIDRTTVTVSGLSSGGFFAHQFHVAYSGLVNGAGIVAAGPYACAEQIPFWLRFNPLRSTIVALTVCSHKGRGTFGLWEAFLPRTPDPSSAADAIRQEHANATIDDPANLADDRVWLFSGAKDREVPLATVRALQRSYELAGVRGANIRFVEEARANHGMPIEQFSDAGGGPGCDVNAPPYLIDCDYDAARLLLEHLYAGGFKDQPKAPERRRLVRFDQTAFFDASNRSASMDREGYVYVPQACATGATTSARCRLHIAFHGCKQSASFVHDAFYWHAGYNRWAEANDIVVLYPQAAAQAWINPDGCWDWWGHTGRDYHRRAGKQMRAVKAMIDRLLGN